MAEIHPAAADGFEAGAAAYERARPDYPPEAVEWFAETVGVGEGGSVLDLAAGTGKLTRRLVATGAHVIAVEPVAAMRAGLQRSVPSASVLEGTAEAIPLDSESVGAVTVGQAFHWFDTERALPEIARVLHPGGALAVFLNIGREGSAYDVFHAIVDPYRGDTPRHRDDAWRLALAESPLFADPLRRGFEFEHRLDRRALSDLVFSISFMAALDPDQRRRVEGEIDRGFAAASFPLALAFRCEVTIYPVTGSRA